MPDARIEVGARFLRADLHVHTHPDSEVNPSPDLAGYIAAAISSGIDIMAVTDHNSASFVRQAIKAADGTPLVIIPGVEISTHQGHLLALFSPDDVETLEGFAHADNLKLKLLSPTEKRSVRGMVDLVDEIHVRGGLAIPAHVDAGNGMCEKLGSGELAQLLSSPALAGIEFANAANLATWFTDDDVDPGRLAAWKARQKSPDLKDRGLARLMSSDAHSPDKVGRDRASRTLTRLRIDDPNFSAIRNAIALNPKARCKAEAVLPAAYPRVLDATFKGGFLDGVSMAFSPNLNCLIGGRGSGKSTALLSIRAALGAGTDEDIDDPDRMPDLTTVRFVDGAGSMRKAIRRRGQSPVDENGAPIRLRLADLGQDESGRLARGYKDEPTALLEFLDGFIVRHEFDERHGEIQAGLEDNAAEIRRTSGVRDQIKTLQTEQTQLEASLQAATDGKVEEIAKWARLLASQGPLLSALDDQIAEILRAHMDGGKVDLDDLAADFGVDLSEKPASGHVEGSDGLRARLASFEARRKEITSKVSVDLSSAGAEVVKSIAAWKATQEDLQSRLAKRQTELEAKGLKVQAGAVLEIAKRLNTVKTNLTGLRKKQDEHAAARKARDLLVDSLHDNRERLFRTREATMKRIAAEANHYSDDLTIRVYFEEAGVADVWESWLTNRFPFKRPRVSRLAATVSPREFARWLIGDRPKILALKDNDGSTFFQPDQLERKWSWSDIFELEAMCLEDRPRIEVQRRGQATRREFDHLSAGQQRSVLLSLLLCAERSEPLVLDQPEDHLDGQYIAQAVVRHLEAAKERRQILIATHSANLTVLGDAELVLPMRATDKKGEPYSIGAVDRPDTREQVCALLEGGQQAFIKRGERYGLRFTSGA